MEQKKYVRTGKKNARNSALWVLIQASFKNTKWATSAKESATKIYKKT
jgi:hypothetical protein